MWLVCVRTRGKTDDLDSVSSDVFDRAGCCVVTTTADGENMMTIHEQYKYDMAAVQNRIVDLQLEQRHLAEEFDRAQQTCPHTVCKKVVGQFDMGNGHLQCIECGFGSTIW